MALSDRATVSSPSRRLSRHDRMASRLSLLEGLLLASVARARAKSSAPAAAADFGRPGAMRVTAHPRAARTPTASVKNGIVILAALVLAHDPAQAQQLDQERGTVRACEQAGAALGCATWPEICASFHLGLHPLALPAVQILGNRFGTSSEWFRTLLGHKSPAKALHPGMPHKMLV